MHATVFTTPAVLHFITRTPDRDSNMLRCHPVVRAAASIKRNNKRALVISNALARPPIVERSLSHISPDLGYTKVSKGVYIGTPLYGPQDAHHLAAALNVGTVLCLQTASELDAMDINLIRVVQEASFAGIEHVHVPIEAGYESLVSAVAALINSRKVYVHDADGGARAATVVAAYHYWVRNTSLPEAVSMVDAVCVGSDVATDVVAAATHMLLGQEVDGGALDAQQHDTLLQALRA